MSTLKFLIAGVCGLLVSCAVITVNVYFPEKAVKDAYKSVDGMMLKGGGNTQPVPESQPADSKDKDSAVKPLSSMFRMSRHSLLLRPRMPRTILPTPWRWNWQACRKSPRRTSHEQEPFAGA